MSANAPGKTALIEMLLKVQVLEFGDFTLKSGRQSPYFFNLGKLSAGLGFKLLASGYRARLEAEALKPEVLFGPAYKGIPLAVAVALDWASDGVDVGVAYNRKEAKAHGEGGVLVGAPIDGQRIVLLDDVLTAGTALREAAAHIDAGGGQLEGVVIALDRQERVAADRPSVSAVAALAEELEVPVLSLLTLEDVLTFVDQNANSIVDLPGMDHKTLRDRLTAYRDEYCVA